MTLRVRAAAPEDAAALSALATATFPLACPPGVDPADVAAFCRENLAPSHLAAHVAHPARDVLLVEDDARPGVPVAYALVLDEDPPAGVDVPRASRMLSKLYAHPDVHGTGAASLLVEAVLDAVRARGAVAVWLGVNRLNVRAQRFYARQGFAVVGTRRMRVGADLHDDDVLARDV